MTAENAVTDDQRVKPMPEQVDTYARREVELRQRFLKGVLDTEGVLDGLQALQGRNRVAMVDLGADPYLPNGWSVDEHRKGKVAKLERKGDDLYLDGKKIEFWLSREQKHGVITGTTLRAKLKDKPVLNANVLDYLLKNPHLIPNSWQGKWVFFWGTIYCDSDGDLCVRCLCWGWDYSWLGSGFGSGSLAAVSAS